MKAVQTGSMGPICTYKQVKTKILESHERGTSPQESCYTVVHHQISLF